MTACAKYCPMLKSVKIVILARIHITREALINPRLLG
jgi:hypothetical protein